MIKSKTTWLGLGGILYAGLQAWVTRDLSALPGALTTGFGLIFASDDVRL